MAIASVFKHFGHSGTVSLHPSIALVGAGASPVAGTSAAHRGHPGATRDARACAKTRDTGAMCGAHLTIHIAESSTRHTVRTMFLAMDWAMAMTPWGPMQLPFK